jgi:hypothetical protein
MNCREVATQAECPCGFGSECGAWCGDGSECHVRPLSQSNDRIPHIPHSNGEKKEMPAAITGSLQYQRMRNWQEPKNPEWVTKRAGTCDRELVIQMLSYATSQEFIDQAEFDERMTVCVTPKVTRADLLRTLDGVPWDRPEFKTLDTRKADVRPVCTTSCHWRAVAIISLALLVFSYIMIGVIH